MVPDGRTSRRAVLTAIGAGATVTASKAGAAREGYNEPRGYSGQRISNQNGTTIRTWHDTREHETYARVTGNPHRILEIEVTITDALHGSDTIRYENPSLPFEDTYGIEQVLAAEIRNADGEIVNSL